MHSAEPPEPRKILYLMTSFLIPWFPCWVLRGERSYILVCHLTTLKFKRDSFNYAHCDLKESSQSLVVISFLHSFSIFLREIWNFFQPFPPLL